MDGQSVNRAIGGVIAVLGVVVAGWAVYAFLKIRDAIQEASQAEAAAFNAPIVTTFTVGLIAIAAGLVVLTLASPRPDAPQREMDSTPEP